jgi:hypothetical protein
MNLTTEIAANLFHYGQSLIVLEIIKEEKFLQHEKLNFELFLTQNGYRFDDLPEKWLTLYNYGKLIGAWSIHKRNSENEDVQKCYWESINGLREFLMSNNLDPKRVGLRAHEISNLNKLAFEKGYN